MVAEGDQVAWHWSSYSTNPTTGQPQRQQGVSMCRIIDGRIKDRAAYCTPTRDVSESP